MARSNAGILGAFVGTIGPVTGFMRNGQNILRTSTSSVKPNAHITTGTAGKDQPL